MSTDPNRQNDVAAALQRPGESLRDPRSLRALAHPLRLRLLGILRTEGAHSVGQLAGMVGEAPGSVSYHLGTLAEFGFILPAQENAKDGRERWWRAAHSHTVVNPVELREDPEQSGAARALQQTILQSYLGELLAAVEAETALEPEWVAASTSSDSFAHLTAPQLAELTAELAALSRKWEAASRPGAEGARAVRWIFHAFPQS